MNSVKDMKRKNKMDVYLVTDVGNVSPCYGIIAGIFDNLKDAQEHLEKLQMNPDNDKELASTLRVRKLKYGALEW